MSSTKSEVADQLFQTFLKDVTLSESDRARRELALLSLPTHLKKAAKGSIKNVVLFPHGTFYHGLGFKDAPLTAYVCLGYLIEQPKGADDDADDSDEQDEDDDDSSTGSINSSDSDDSSHKSQIVSSVSYAARMPQTLLIDIYDVLINRDNSLFGTYKDVNLTRQGKLYYLHHQFSSTGISNNCQLTSELECVLEARSFLPVQTSRLIKFYCLLDQLFWPFAQLILHWCRDTGVLELPGKSDGDGLKQEHVLQLVIFFLVRRRVIPSIQLLQRWAMTPMLVDEINTSFCENLEIVRKNCQMMNIGSTGPEEWTLERILQIACQFFTEMGCFNFAELGIRPSSGTSFVKFSGGQLLVHNPMNKRRLDTNSLLCIQDIFDPCQNITRKVSESWVIKFTGRCREASVKLLPLLWKGDVLQATLVVLDVPKDSEEACDSWEEYKDPVITMSEFRRCIKFRVPPKTLDLLNHCFQIAENVELRLSLQRHMFHMAVKTLFTKFLEEFNSFFWTKLVAGRLVENTGGYDPIHFDEVDPLHCPTNLSPEEKAIHVVKAIMDLHASSDTSLIEFYVVSDWTKQAREDIMANVGNKSAMEKTVNQLLMGVDKPHTVFGKRAGMPMKSEIMAVVQLFVKHEEKGLYLISVVGQNQSPQFQDVNKVKHFIDCYQNIIQTFIVKRLALWIGGHVKMDVNQRWFSLFKEERKKRAEEIQKKLGTTIGTVCGPVKRRVVKAPGELATLPPVENWTPVQPTLPPAPAFVPFAIYSRGRGRGRAGHMISPATRNVRLPNKSSARGGKNVRGKLTRGNPY